MSYQKLILPTNNMKLTASRLNKSYKSKFGYDHYGCDSSSLVGNRKVYALGTGTVVSSGWDRLAGYVVIIRYNSVYNHKTGKVQDIIIRQFHFESVLVKSGQSVTKDTVLGYYGGSGFGIMNKWVYHLHTEADYDTSYPRYSPTFSANSNIILKGNDRDCFNPLEVMHIKSTAPDYQTYTTVRDAYINQEDYSLPSY